MALPLIAEEGLVMKAEAKRESPQIAYNLFSTWADNYVTDSKKGKAVSSGILFGLGAFGLAGSALTWFGGDSISQDISGSPMDPEVKQGLALGLGIGGGASIVIGTIIAAAPIKDYRAIYSDVFEERDPEVREAMAVSVLQYQSSQGRQSRIRSAITSIVFPIVFSACMAGIGSESPDDFSRDFLRNWANNCWWSIGGVISLFSKSNEERRYDRYLVARDAYYGTRK
jgi:hypothetical protein